MTTVDPKAGGSTTDHRAWREELGRELLVAWIHLAVLWSLAFAKPLFDVLADSPEFFVARGNTRGDILIFSIGLVLLPPTAMVAVEAAVSPLPAVRRFLHLGLVAALVAAFALQIVDDALGASAAISIAIAVVLGIVAVVAYVRTAFVPTILTVLGPVPVLFLVLFLAFSPVSDLVLPQHVEEAGATNIDSSTPVVFVVFDEFDPNMLMDAHQRIDATRYPHFAELAHRAVWYRNATTVNGFTAYAVPSVLSGRRAPGGAVPTQADYPNSVFTLLGGRYEFHVQEPATDLCPERLCGSPERGSTNERVRSLVEDLSVVSLHLLLPESLRSGLPAVDRTFGNFRTGGRDGGGSADSGKLGPTPATVLARASSVEGLLNGIRKGDGKPTFDFAHLLLPHVPWEYLPTGQEYPAGEPDTPGLEDEMWDRDPVLAHLGMQRHILQVGYADRLVGEVIDRLRRAGLYDRALVVFTADHGVSYRPGEPRRRPTPQTLGDIAAVPLFIKYPRERRGRIDDTMVRNIDVVPTIARVLHVRLPYRAEGEPIRSGHDVSETVAVDRGGDGTTFKTSFASFVRAREAGLRRMVSMFGSDDGGRGLYAVGPGRDLLGRPFAPLTTGATPPARVDFAGGQVFGPVRPDAELVPSLLSGRLTGQVAPGTPIAVAVNGRIRGVSQTFSAEGATRLSVMIPPASYRAGRNRIDVLMVDRTAGRTRLTALDVPRAADYRIVERDGNQVLAGDGAEVPIEDGNVRGAIDSLERQGRAIRVGGWAVSAPARRPATRILVFAGGRLLGQGAPELMRPDVAKAWKSSEVARSGFEFDVTGAGIDPGDIRVVAAYRDGASQLPVYHP